MFNGSRDECLLAKVTSLEGFEDLSLGLNVRDDGDVLVSYLQRSDAHEQFMSWLGPHAGLRGVVLLDNAWSAGRGSAILIPGLAAVIAGSASRVLEECRRRVSTCSHAGR